MREAACEGMAELVAKIEPDAVRPFLPQILSCLLSSFKDASWPVSSEPSIYALSLCPRHTLASLEPAYVVNGSDSGIVG